MPRSFRTDGIAGTIGGSPRGETPGQFSLIREAAIAGYKRLARGKLLGGHIMGT